MSALIDYIQIEIHKTYNKKYSKKYIEDKLIPIINYICSSKSKKFLFGGSQGIGKSSFINIISKTIEKFYNKKILLLNLDNYYLSKKQRLLLSKQIHQLLITRGVPGTHDIEKLIKHIKQSSFDNVFKWRLKQEKTNQSKNKKSKRMTPNEIKYFVQHYEKITKWMMKDLNKKAQIVIKFEKNHKISSINFN